MNSPIFIDTQSLTEEFTMDRETLDQFMDGVVKEVTVRWAQGLEQQAMDHLKSTRQNYLQAIKVIDSGKMSGTVVLDYTKDPLVRMVEEGMSPFDMKKGFMSSKKIKVGKNGKRYLTIPFRLGTPGVVGDNGFFSLELPEAVYKVLQKQPTPISFPGGERSEGLTPEQIPSPHDKKQIRPSILSSDGKVLFGMYQHKHSVFEGAFKQKDGVTGQNTYGSFRRVSMDSDPLSWIHKGIQEFNLFQKNIDNFPLEETISQAIDINLINLGFGDE